MANHCRVCGSNDLELAVTLPQSPGSISRLFRSDEFALDIATEIEVYRCRECSFTQHFNFVPDTFYDDYIMTVTHSPQMCEYQKRQAAHFADYFKLAGASVIEVGCGDGNYMGYLKGHCGSVCGIEPSASFRREAERSGHKVFAGYVTESSPAPSGPYEAFVTRQVLEHVPHPIDFLKGIRLSLTSNGVGLVEVPSLEQALGNGRFFDLFRDHVNYFTFETLLTALRIAGFETLHMDRGMNGEFLVAYVRIAKLVDLTELGSIRNTLADQIREFVKSKIANGKKVAVWGAGGKGLSCMAAVGDCGVSYVVDSDPHKIGLYTPVVKLKVVSPETLRTDPVDAIILTSLAYKSEVISHLRDTLNFKGEIAAIGKQLEIIGS